METKLAYTENLNRQLEVEIATLSDMKKIESIAKDKFGMIEPERGQRVYLNVGSDKKNDVHMTNKNENKSIFSKILGLVVK
jgi:cell division protein FtsB